MQKLDEALFRNFRFEGEFREYEENTSGHINGTYQLTYQQADGSLKKYIVQKINTTIVTKPVELMENIDKVTKYIRSIAAKEGKDPERSTLHIIKTTSGGLFYVDAAGDYWRAYNFIDGCVAYDRVEKPEDFYNAGVALGIFQKMLDCYPSEQLVETIENFHNTPSRYRDFQRAVQEDRAGRRSTVADEIAFFEERQDFYDIITKRLEDGSIPVRVTHNDTKLNNVLIDRKTDEVVCLIDMDTVMPGSALYDFGDSIRFGTNTAAEDERDLEKVRFDLDLYREYTNGYLSEMKEKLMPAELALLPESAILMTLECGMRFLGDHLNGDVYFSIHRPGHNLDRARTQIRLALEMEQNIEKMREITSAACKSV